MIHIESYNFASLYEAALRKLKNDGSEITVRGIKTLELNDVVLTLVNPLESLYKNPVRGSQKRYISAELLWYFMGKNDSDFISKYAKFWKTIENEDGTVNSAYGNLIFNKRNRYGISQYEWAFKSLLNDPYTRQAILHFNLPEHQYFGNKDFVCTVYAIFSIRNNKLNFKVSMRSNDAIWGTPTDIAFFTILQQQMLLHLKTKYKDLELGTYTHCIDSFHVYERHFNLLDRMLNEKFEPEEFPVLKSNLVNEQGTPTETLRLMYENHDEYIPVKNDSIYGWIQDNLKNNVEING